MEFNNRLSKIYASFQKNINLSGATGHNAIK